MQIEIRKDILSWFKSSFPSQNDFLLDQFKDSTGIYLIGSAVRSYFNPMTPRDIDVTIDGISSEDLKKVKGIELIYFTPSSLGGHVKVDGMVIDMWPLKETFGLKEFGLPVSIEGIIKRAALNIDKIAIDLKSGRFYDDGCLDAINQQIISYHPARPFMDEIQAARILVYQHKTGYGLDSSALDHIQRVRSNMSTDSRKAIFDDVSKKYPHLVGYVFEKLGL